MLKWQLSYALVIESSELFAASRIRQYLTCRGCDINRLFPPGKLSVSQPMDSSQALDTITVRDPYKLGPENPRDERDLMESFN